MGGKKLNLVGQKFNRLNCLKFVKYDKHFQSIFRFECDCGNIIDRKGYEVKNNHVKSCGCLRNEKSSARKRSNLIGQKFNKLTCLEFIKKNSYGKYIYKFKCDCGNITEAIGASVKNGYTKTCGCLQKDLASFSGSLVGLNNGRSDRLGWCYGTMHMRSGYEIFYTHYLDINKIDWEYEPETFKLKEGMRYTPDFYLPELKLWVEIKGKMTDKNRQKISLFRSITGYKLNVYFLKDIEKLAGISYQNFMKENKHYYL